MSQQYCPSPQNVGQSSASTPSATLGDLPVLAAQTAGGASRPDTHCSSTSNYKTLPEGEEEAGGFPPPAVALSGVRPRCTSRQPEGEEATVQDPITTAAAATGGSGGVAPGRKSTLPVHALVHAFHCNDDRCTQRTCFETKGVLKRMVRSHPPANEAAWTSGAGPCVACTDERSLISHRASAAFARGTVPLSSEPDNAPGMQGLQVMAGE